jgi:hypothetical protein
VEDNVLSYGDLRIVVREKLPEVLSRLLDLVQHSCRHSSAGRDDNVQRAFDFEQLLPEIVETSGNVEVDGVPLTYCVKQSAAENKLYYINDRKIVVADLEEVINRAVCYRRRPELYQQFLRQVSAISLKFHRACTQGLPFGRWAISKIVNAAMAAELSKNEEHVKLPNDFADVRIDKDIELKVPFRKQSSSARGEVFILDAWRKVENFDLLLVGLEGRQGRLRRTQILSPQLSALDGEIVKLFYTIDRSLEPSCRILAGHITASEYTRSQQVIACTSIEAVKQLVKRFLKLVKIDAGKYLEAVKRSRELFDRIVEQENVQHYPAVTDAEQYWVVTGKSGRRYQVDRDGKVTDLASGSHICIVNGGGRDLGGWDYLSSLIAALASDTMVAASIATLKPLLK